MDDPSTGIGEDPGHMDIGKDGHLDLDKDGHPDPEKDGHPDADKDHNSNDDNDDEDVEGEPGNDECRRRVWSPELYRGSYLGMVTGFVYNFKFYFQKTASKMSKIKNK